MLKVGIIGGGFTGDMHAQCYKAFPGRCEIKGIVDVNPKRAKDLEEKFKVRIYRDAQELIDEKDVDVIDVCLPTYLHKEYVLKAARARKHVLCEKPIALTVKDGEEMVKATKKANVKFMIAHVIRFWPEYVCLKELVKRKELGRLKSITLTRLAARPICSWKNWMQKSEKSGGAFIDLHIHDTDFARYLLGWPKKISSYAVKTKYGWDHVFSTFYYMNGVIANLEGGWDMSDNYPFTMAFTANFDEGTVEYNNRHNIFNIYKVGGKTELLKLSEEITAEGSIGNVASLGGYLKEIEYFLDLCSGKKVSKIITPEDAVMSLRLIQEELKDARKK